MPASVQYFLWMMCRYQCTRPAFQVANLLNYSRSQVASVGLLQGQKYRILHETAFLVHINRSSRVLGRTDLRYCGRNTMERLCGTSFSFSTIMVDICILNNCKYEYIVNSRRQLTKSLRPQPIVTAYPQLMPSASQKLTTCIVYDPISDSEDSALN